MLCFLVCLHLCGNQMGNCYDRTKPGFLLFIDQFSLPYKEETLRTPKTLKNYKGGEILVLRKWRLWASFRKLFPLNICEFFFFFGTFEMQPLLSKHILVHAAKKYPILTFLSEGWRFMWAEAKDLSLLEIKFSAKCVREVSNWLVMFTCGENLNETGEILIKS